MSFKALGIHNFKKVDTESIIPNGFTIHNKNACSSCMNAFLISCFLLENDITENIDVYMGSLVESADIINSRSIHST